jgi:hypothetical protein
MVLGKATEQGHPEATIRTIGYKPMVLALIACFDLIESPSFMHTMHNPDHPCA